MNTKPIRSASHPVTNDVVFDLICSRAGINGKILDFGSGPGHMCQRLGDYFKQAGHQPGEHLSACEVNPAEFLYPEIECHKISPDSEIPFTDNYFDLIYAIEVIEHMRRPYDLFCEVYKKLKPGGVFLFTTPNLLQMKSRLDFLLTGFGDMYPPPSSLDKNAGRICGHIMPLNLSYFAYGARRAGFEEPDFHLDRRKRSATFLSVLLWPLLKIASWQYNRTIKNYDLDDWEENREIIAQMNSFDLLTSRSCIITVKKPEKDRQGSRDNKS